MTTPATTRIILRPLAGSSIAPDGSQFFEVVEQDALPWSATTTYALGGHVQGSDGKVYISKIARNLGHDPTTDAAVRWQGLW